MKDNFNFDEYDRITVTTKTENEEKILRDYSIFGWEWIKKENDVIFANLVHLTFMRPHRIKNKDQLQYQQVCYEQKINTLFEFERTKNLFSTLWFIFLVSLFVSFGGLGVYFMLKSKILLGGIFLFIGVASACLTPLIKRVRVKENRRHREKVNKLNEEIEDALKKVAFLTGVQDEK